MVDQTKTPQVRPFEGEFADYKEEILAEIRANEEQALVEAELRARVRRLCFAIGAPPFNIKRQRQRQRQQAER